MNRFSMLLPALCALTAACSTAQETLRVGSWNLEHFGERDNPGPRKPQDYKAIAEKIREIGVDVLGVQEIRTLSAIERLRTQLGDHWSYVLGTTGTFSNNSGQIAVGFLWNRNRVELVQAEELLQLPSKVNELSTFHRKPVDAVFRARGGGVDFRAIVVHFKASRGAKNEAKRKAETAALRAYVQGLYAKEGEDRDIVVLGDFNHTYGAPAHKVMTKGGFFEYLKAPGSPRTIVHFPEPIDHAAITKGLREDLVAKRLTVHVDQAEKDLEAWRAVYSDHIPVSFELQAESDRDPDATFTPAGKTQWLGHGGKSAKPRMKIVSASAGARPAPKTPFGAGASVELTYVETMRGGDGVIDVVRKRRGTLLSAPHDWVELATDTGEVLSFPRERVVSILSQQ